MREILFRGKRRDNGEWVYGNYGFNDTFTDENHYIFQNKAWEFFVDPATVGQYTGLTDKNGKKIFEGDILRLFTIWADGTVEPVDVPVIVQFCENDQCYVLTTKQGSHYDDFGNYGSPEYYEVVGNIHDNPELLEVEE